MKTLNSLILLSLLSACILPTPKPVTPPPVTPPTTVPTPPVQPPTPPVVNPPAPVAHCPVQAPADSKYILSKIHSQKPNADGTFTYMLDSTPRVGRSSNPEATRYCSTLTGIPGNRDCKANPEGSGLQICDAEFLGTPCPVWYYLNPGTGQWSICGVDPHPIASCDHFDGYIEWQGPYTGQCLTRNGFPVTGFRVIPHGKTSFKACDESGNLCSDPIALDQ